MLEPVSKFGEREAGGGIAITNPEGGQSLPWALTLPLPLKASS